MKFTFFALCLAASTAGAGIYDYRFSGTMNGSISTFEVTYRVDTSVAPTVNDPATGAFWFGLGNVSTMPIEFVHLTISDGTDVFLDREDMLRPGGNFQTVLIRYDGSNSRPDAVELVCAAGDVGIDNITIQLLGDTGATGLGGNTLPTATSQLDLTNFNQRRFEFNASIGTVLSADVTLLPAPATAIALTCGLGSLARRRRVA